MFVRMRFIIFSVRETGSVEIMIASFWTLIVREFVKSAVLHIDAKFRLWLRNSTSNVQHITLLIIDSIRYFSPHAHQLALPFRFPCNERCKKKYRLFVALDALFEQYCGVTTIFFDISSQRRLLWTFKTVL